MNQYQLAIKEKIGDEEYQKLLFDIRIVSGVELGDEEAMVETAMDYFHGAMFNSIKLFGVPVRYHLGVLRLRLVLAVARLSARLVRSHLPKQVKVWAYGMPITGDRPFFIKPGYMQIMSRHSEKYAGLLCESGRVGVFRLSDHRHYHDFGTCCTACDTEFTGFYCDSEGNVLPDYIEQVYEEGNTSKVLSQ